MDLQKLAQLAKSNPAAAKAFLSKKDTSQTPRKIEKEDKVFTERQLQTIVSALVQKEVSKIPTPKDGKTPSKEEITAIIQPLMPVIRQPKDGKDAEWTPEVVDKIANKVLKQVAVTPDLTQAILKVFSQEKITADAIPGFTELKERVEKLARNQKFIGQGKGIASGYTDSDVLRVLAANGYTPGGGGSVSDEAYGGTWDGVTDEAPSKNAVFDKIESLVLGSGTGDVVGPASAVDSNIAAFDTTTGKLIKDGGATIAQVRDRSTHTGTQTASTISDFDTEVSNNTDVAANTSARHSAVTIAAGRDYITLSGQELTLGQVDLTTDVTGDLPLSNIAQQSAHSVLGRAGAGTGDVASITMGNDTILGRAGSGNVDDLSATQVRTIINVEDGAAADQVASEVPFTPAGNIAATDVQAAIQELDTEKQPLDAELTAIAGLISVADRLPYFTGSGTAALATFTSTARNLLDDTSTTAMRTTLGVGTGDSPQFTAVNVGNASDTTLSRLSAGQIAVEGVQVATASNTLTLTNKTLTSPTISGATMTGTTGVDLITYDAARGKVTAGGNLGATETINFNDETNYTGTLDSNITFTFANATSGDDVTLYLSYDGVSQRTITWPTITWLDNATGAAPATPAASGNVLVVTIRYIGTTFYGSATGNYAVYA